MSVGSRLKQLRKRRGLTQKELAEPRYSHAYVSTIESGNRQPSQQALAYFADKLQTSIEELQSGRPADLTARLEIELVSARRLASSGHLDSAEQSYDKVKESARRFGLVDIQARGEVGRALCAERRGALQQAIQGAERAEQLLHARPATARVEAITVKSRCLHMQGDTRHSAFILERAIDELELQRLSDPLAIMRLHASLVAVYFELGLHKKAADSAAIVLDLTPKVNDAEQVANAHINVARVLLAQGAIQDAMDSLRRAEDLYRSLELRIETGRAHLAQGYILSRQEKYKRALAQLQKARLMFSKCSSGLDEARATNEIARVRRITGRREEAIGLLNRSLKLLKDSHHVTVLALAHRELGWCLSDEDTLAAETHFRESIRLFESAEESIDVAVTYRFLGDVLRKQGKNEAGWEMYREGILFLERAVVTSG